MGHTIYYSIYAKVPGLDPGITLANSIRGHAAAVWMAEQIRQSLQLTNSADPAYAGQQRG